MRRSRLVWSFVLFVPFCGYTSVCLFVALFKQTENVGEVVRPNYIALHSAPARVIRN